MPSLTPVISFNVQFLLGGLPAIQLTVITTATNPLNLVGYFEITQPDGIKVSGNYISPDITGSSLSFTTLLRLDAYQKYQKGEYKITLYGSHPDYTPGVFTRDFIFTYIPTTQVISEDFDLYTPSLKYTDHTIYPLSGYTTTIDTYSWSATTVVGSIVPSTTSIFDLVIGGNYYDAKYLVSYTKVIAYNATWLTIQYTYTYTKTGITYTPQSMIVLLGYLTTLKTALDSAYCSDLLQELYEKAEALYAHIRARICAHDTVGLKNYFDQYYTLTHNYQPYFITNTNVPIQGYDFTTGCGGGGSGSFILTYTMRATPGVNMFTIPYLLGKTIITATRSGFSKGITASTTTDVEYVQIVNNVITLPVGDTIATVVLPDGSIVGELFLFTYQVSSIPLTYTLRAVVGATTFTIAALTGKTILTATRSGFNKGITTLTTSDTEYLQIVNNVVTMPVGDKVITVVLPDGTITGELFLFTYQ